MRKIVLTVIGFAFTLSLGFHDFNSVALNKGDGGGAPADNKGDGGVSQL